MLDEAPSVTLRAVHEDLCSFVKTRGGTLCVALQKRRQIGLRFQIFMLNLNNVYTSSSLLSCKYMCTKALPCELYCIRNRYGQALEGNSAPVPSSTDESNTPCGDNTTLIFEFRASAQK